MSQCVGICQMDEFGYCIGCGRTQDEIDGIEPSSPTADEPRQVAPAREPDAG